MSPARTTLPGGVGVCVGFLDPLPTAEEIAAIRDIGYGSADSRQALSRYLQLCLGMPNYRNNLLCCGFSDAELSTADDGPVEALVVDSAPRPLADRPDAQYDAGADHVAVQFVPPPAAGVIARVANGIGEMLSA